MQRAARRAAAGQYLWRNLVYQVKPPKFWQVRRSLQLRVLVPCCVCSCWVSCWQLPLATTGLVGQAHLDVLAFLRGSESAKRMCGRQRLPSEDLQQTCTCSKLQDRPARVTPPPRKSIGWHVYEYTHRKPG